MVPAAGERFTWTLNTFRKMLMRVLGSPSTSTTEMSVTLPSAGETIAPSIAGIWRSGSRKNHRKNPASSSGTTASAGIVNHHTSTATATNASP